MDIHKKNIPVIIGKDEVLVNMKWFRGANSYNNGATRYGRKYQFRLIIGRAKQKELNR